MEQESRLVGTLKQQLVPRHVVDEVIRAHNDRSLHLTVSLFFAGVGASAGLTLLAGIEKPVGVYIALGVAVALTIAFGLLAWREAGRLKKAVKEMNDPEPGHLTQTSRYGLIATGGEPTLAQAGQAEPSASESDDQSDDQDNELTTTITDDGGQEQVSDQEQQTTTDENGRPAQDS